MAKQEKAKVSDAGTSAPLLVDPAWILKMLGILVVAALMCGYLTLCLLFWQGSWQLVLTPTHNPSAFAMPGLNTETVPFGVDERGTTTLTGYWLPGAGTYTALYLRGGDGQLAGDAHDGQNLRLLHEAGLNVLAFDYRGYGAMLKPHASEKTMREDAERAFDYLTQQRGVGPEKLLLYGRGLGGVLAAQLAQKHASVAGVVVDEPDASAVRRLKEDPRGKLLPVSWLMREEFDLKTPLVETSVPKLLLAANGAASNSANDAAVQEAFASAKSPKMSVTLPVADVDARSKATALSRWLNDRIPGARTSRMINLIQP